MASPPRDPPLKLPGEMLGRFEILEKIGSGSSADVFRARDPDNPEPIAIKILNEGDDSNEQRLERFQREARITATLNHPNIVKIYQHGCLDQLHYIAMELLAGGSLLDRLQGEYTAEKTIRESARDTFPSATVISTARQIAGALDHAHGRGVIHLDLKPGNILFAENAATIKITDFGIALLNGQNSGRSQANGAAGTMASPRYMSPEQASGLPPDSRSDLFSTGVILYEMITGQKAFPADTLDELIDQVRSHRPVAIGDLALGTEPALVAIIDKLLEKKPGYRFDSAAGLVSALELAEEKSS
jgi:serine/threonine protein kinase